MPEAFQLSRVVRSRVNWGHRHITGVRTVPTPGKLDRWPVEAVVSRLREGDLFYMISRLGDPLFVHPFRCWCGYETISARLSDDAADAVDALPDCQPENEGAVAS